MDYEPDTGEESEDINSPAYLERLLASEDGDDGGEDEETEVQGESKKIPSFVISS